MSRTNPVVRQLLERMAHAHQENVDALVGAMQRVGREVASLSYSYNGHMLRPGMRNAALQALDWQLEEAATLLARTLLDLEQRLFGNLRTLRGLIVEVEHAPGVDDRAIGDPLRNALEAYCAALEQDYAGSAAVLSALTLRLRLMANNIEIAASHADTPEASASVDMFCAMAALLRTLADRLRATTGDLQIFERTQNGHAESLRAALVGGEEGDAA